MALKFRNLNVTPQDPVEQWGFEGLLAAVERGDINDWHRIALALLKDPRGKVAAELEDVAEAAENPAIPSLLQRIRRQALEDCAERERIVAATELRGLYEASGLDRAQFAARLGTSRYRLSKYLNGSAAPSVTVLATARSIAGRAS